MVSHVQPNGAGGCTLLPRKLLEGLGLAVWKETGYHARPLKKQNYPPWRRIQRHTTTHTNRACIERAEKGGNHVNGSAVTEPLES